MKIVKIQTVVDATELSAMLEAAAIVREVVEIEQWSDEGGTVLYLVIVPYSVIKVLQDIEHRIRKERRKGNERKEKA